MLLILGNGFDLNLGLKTNYSDYMENVNPKDSFYNSKLFNYLSNHLITSDDKYNYRWIDIENELKNYVVQELNKIAQIYQPISQATNRPFKERWNDPELQFYINSFADSLEAEYTLLNESLTNYIKNATKAKMKYDSHASVFIGALKSKYFSQNNIMPNSNINVLNFNYTNEYTVKKLIEDDKVFSDEHINNKPNYILKEKVFYNNIHGSIDEKNIILGIEGTYDLPVRFNFLKKGHSYNYSKGVNIEGLLREHIDIHFYGLSIGETDAPYFRQFFGAFSNPENPFASNLNFKPKNIFFYHHSKNAYTQLINRIDDLTSKNVDRFRQYNKVEFIDIKNYETDYKKEKYFKF